MKREKEICTRDLSLKRVRYPPGGKEVRPEARVMVKLLETLVLPSAVAVSPFGMCGAISTDGY
jgi:hypothetical protein